MRYTAKVLGSEIRKKNVFSEKLVPPNIISKIISLAVHGKDKKD